MLTSVVTNKNHSSLYHSDRSREPFAGVLSQFQWSGVNILKNLSKVALSQQKRQIQAVPGE